MEKGKKKGNDGEGEREEEEEVEERIVKKRGENEKDVLLFW